MTEQATSYGDFISGKRLHDPPTGLKSPPTLSPVLFDFQRDITDWALRRGRAAIFADCGLGKTLMQLEWANAVAKENGARTLIFAPLAVSRQTIVEAGKLGLKITGARKQDDCGQISITNYEMLEHFESKAFDAVVLDECFATGTLVDTPGGCKKAIQDIREGDRIVNASGGDSVAAIHRREVPYAVKVTVDLSHCIASPHHLFFTERGWTEAKNLQAGDYLMESGEAVRLVRSEVSTEVCSNEGPAFLREILLREMEDEAAGDFSEGTFAGGRGAPRAGEVRMVPGREPSGGEGTRAGAESQPDDRSSGARQAVAHSSGDGTRAEGQGRERNWTDGARGSAHGDSRTGMEIGSSNLAREETAGISDLLQGRPRERAKEDRHRGGRPYAQESTSPRREEGCKVGFARVDSVEVLELGHPELDSIRDADGKLYFYDLSAARHPSYSVNGWLVHNSSILKSYSGVYRRALTEFSSEIPYRLACTATPAPNDLVEIINHAEYLGVMRGKEIIALFFTQDGNTTHSWRLKGHARADFYRWLASWCVACRFPSDLGYEDKAFVLPDLTMHEHIVPSPPSADALFAMAAGSITERRQARRDSLDARVARMKDIIGDSKGPWLVWCDLNTESEAATAAIDGAVEVRGSDTREHKERSLLGFAAGEIRALVSKSSIAGFGLNFQKCADVVFLGLSDSYEAYYQAVRRSWRFGQEREVNVHVITDEASGSVRANIERKETQARGMMAEIVANMKGLQLDTGAKREEAAHEIDEETGRGWSMLLGDCMERIKEIPDESVGLSVFSPPFPGMYAYTNSPRDVGNVTGHEKLIEHLDFLIPELLRVSMPGRKCAVHLTQEPVFKFQEGHIGLRDFRGATIRAFEKHDWIFYAEVTIDKCPQLKAQRTKDSTLAFKTMADGDSNKCRPALADYLVIFCKKGENPKPYTAGWHERYKNDNAWISPDEWIEWAAPVWYRKTPGRPGGISESDVLNVRQARETDDERHLCPLQLGVIERAVKLWSAPGDLVLSPFAGIGSEGYEAVRLRREFKGIELKRSYWKSACDNLRTAERLAMGDLFSQGEEGA